MRAGGIGPGPWERGRAAAGGIGTGRVSTAGPRGKEGAQSGRDSDVRNVETPARVQALPGRPTVRRAELPGGNRMPKKRTPAAERQRETLGGISGPSAGWPAGEEGGTPGGEEDAKEANAGGEKAPGNPGRHFRPLCRVPGHNRPD